MVLEVGHLVLATRKLITESQCSSLKPCCIGQTASALPGNFLEMNSQAHSRDLKSEAPGLGPRNLYFNKPSKVILMHSSVRSIPRVILGDFHECYQGLGFLWLNPKETTLLTCSPKVCLVHIWEAKSLFYDGFVPSNLQTPPSHISNLSMAFHHLAHCKRGQWTSRFSRLDQILSGYPVHCWEWNRKLGAL